MISRPATPGLYYDASVRLHEPSARALLAAGCVGVFRYVPLPRNPIGQDINAPELAMLVGLGLEVGLVQHVRMPGWDPRQHSGYEDGQVAVEYAQQAEYPEGAHLWCDFEGPLVGVPSGPCIEYCTQWARGVVEAGYRAGLYCGYDDPMTPEELYLLPGITSYWSDAGHRSVSVRGVAISQGPEGFALRAPLDPDQVAPDLLGDLPFVAAADAIAAAADAIAAA